MLTSAVRVLQLRQSNLGRGNSDTAEASQERSQNGSHGCNVCLRLPPPRAAGSSKHDITFDAGMGLFQVTREVACSHAHTHAGHHIEAFTRLTFPFFWCVAGTPSSGEGGGSDSHDSGDSLSLTASWRQPACTSTTMRPFGARVWLGALILSSRSCPVLT